MRIEFHPSFYCEGCGTHFWSSAPALAHERGCDHNPKNKTCFTCSHYYYEKKTRCRKGHIKPECTYIMRGCEFWHNIANLNHEVER